jgi:hypothetical protein
MMATLVQFTPGVQAADGNSFVSTAFGANNTAGNTLIAGISLNSNHGSTIYPITTITDTQGNVWKTLGAAYNFTGSNVDGLLQFAIALNCKAGANTVTVNMSSSNNYKWANLAEVNGASVLDQYFEYAGSGTTMSIGPVNTAADGEFCFIQTVFDAWAPSVTPSGGWTEQNPTDFVSELTQIQATKGSLTGTATNGGGGTLWWSIFGTFSNLVDMAVLAGKWKVDIH